MTRFVDELVCYCTGGEDAALSAILPMAIAGGLPAGDFTIAATHWQYADDAQRDALAAYLGISQKYPSEQCPVPTKLGATYKRVMAAACQYLYEQEI